MAYFNILIFGDAVGRPGRQALIKELPQLKEKFKPDLTVLNAENLAHGYGVTSKLLTEMMNAGIDFFTSGNHIFQNTKDLKTIFTNFPIIRPANYESGTIGVGYEVIKHPKTEILYINMIGRVFFDGFFENPFKKIDEILKKEKKKRLVFIDFHAEATSEKRSFGAHCDGRATLVYGTHTHVQTSDEYIMPKGTGYITDVGMVGLQHSSLGMDFTNIIKNFIEGTRAPKTIADHGHCQINGVFAKINIDTGKIKTLKRINLATDI